MITRHAAFAFLLAALLVTGGRAQGAERESERARTDTVGVIAAGRDPVSIRIVDEFAAVMTSDTRRLLPIVGRGPVATALDLIKLKGADIGIVPSDVLPYLTRDGRLAGADQALRYIAKLYEEDVHVLARRDIRGIADLANARVNFGPRDSADSVTGSVLFGDLRIPVEPMSLDPAAALQALKRGEIAALVHVARKPAPLFFDLNQDDGLHFLPVPLTAGLSATYLPGRLAAEDYPMLVGRGEAGGHASIDSVAVPMVLAVYDWAPRTGRYRDLAGVVDTLFERAAILEGPSRDPLWKSFDPAAEVPGWRRFGPAEARLRGEVAVGSGTPPAAPARRQVRKSRAKDEGAREPPAAGETTQGHEALFEEFLRRQSGR